MEKELSEKRFIYLLSLLCEERALEIVRGDEHTLYIPYIMNDAVEAYCILSEVVIPGSLPKDLSEADGAQIREGEQKKGLVIRKGEEMNDLGAQYYDGSRGFEQSFEKAVHFYKMAAEQGNRQAEENLGYCYYYGREGKPDYEKAFHALEWKLA